MHMDANEPVGTLARGWGPSADVYGVSELLLRPFSSMHVLNCWLFACGGDRTAIGQVRARIVVWLAA